MKNEQLQLVACRAISNGALKQDKLPTSLKILDWGENEVCDGSRVLLDEKSIAPFEAIQKKTGRLRVPLDYNHSTVKGTEAHKDFGDTPNIFAYGTAVIRPGDGLYLDELKWTPFGRKYARNCEDISPAPVLKNGRVIGLDSCALTPTGAIDGLTFYSAQEGVLATFSSVEAYAAAHPEPDEDDFGGPSDEDEDDHDSGCLCASCMAAKTVEFEAEDHKTKYGDVEYADTKNHKYPIDTDKHVRAAWSYINMPKNQKGYSPAEVAAIKKRIRSKFKTHGIEESDTTKPKTKPMAAPKFHDVKDIPASSGQPSNYENLSMEIKAHIAKFRAELGLPETMSDEDVMDRVRGHWDSLKAKQPNLSLHGGSEAELEKGNIPASQSEPHATITYTAIVEKAVKEAIAPLTARLDKVEKEKMSLPSDAEQKKVLIQQASRDGKIVPLMAQEDIDAVPLPVFIKMVKNLPVAQVPMTPRVRPLSADDNKNERAVAVQTTKSAWAKAVS